jgi:hypothetical protein
MSSNIPFFEVAHKYRLFHLFVAKFSGFSFLQTLPEGSNFLDSDVQIYADEDDLDYCLYYLRTLSNILRWSSDSMWAALAQNSISLYRKKHSN